MSELTAAVDLDAVVAFMNTIDEELGTDALGDRDAAAAWLAEAGLAPAATAVSAPDLERAHRLREALRDQAEAHHDGEVDAGAVTRLNAVVDELRPTLRFGAEGDVELDAAGDGASRALGLLVAAVAAAVAHDAWRRVKLCRSDTCRYAFYDASRNRSGRWCSMAVCGNREKVRAFRQRQGS